MKYTDLTLNACDDSLSQFKMHLASSAGCNINTQLWLENISSISCYFFFFLNSPFSSPGMTNYLDLYFCCRRNGYAGGNYGSIPRDVTNLSSHSWGFLLSPRVLVCAENWGDPLWKSITRFSGMLLEVPLAGAIKCVLSLIFYFGKHFKSHTFFINKDL